MDRTDTAMKGRHSAVARAAMRNAPPIFRAEALRLQQRQKRQGWPRPGGAARRASEWIRLPSGCDLSIVKEAMKAGGRIEIVVGWQTRVTLAGDQLRLLVDRLPDTALGSLPGRPVSDCIDLSGCGELAMLADVVILGAREDQGHHVLTLDLPDVPIAADETSADHPARSQT